MNELTKTEANKILNELETRIDLGREKLIQLPEDELNQLISDSLASYFFGLSADRSGAKEIAAVYYQKSFGLLSTNIEALDNYAIGLVEDLKFAEAIPYLEQSVFADSSSPLALVYLVKCYQETGKADLAEMTANYLRFCWPDKSPYLDWSHLGQAKAKPLLVPPFKEGQVWKVKSSSEPLRVWVRLADIYKGEALVHVSLAHVPGLDGQPMFVSHLPFSAAALKNSDLELTDECQELESLEDHFGGGYATWNSAHQQGRAGAFSVPLSEVLETVYASLKSIDPTGE